MTTRQFETTTSVKNNSAVLLHSASSSRASGDTRAETELIILGAAVLPLIE
jgi:hypothetical protein